MFPRIPAIEITLVHYQPGALLNSWIREKRLRYGGTHERPVLCDKATYLWPSA
jgi:hypothetical protein